MSYFLEICLYLNTGTKSVVNKIDPVVNKIDQTHENISKLTILHCLPDCQNGLLIGSCL